MLKNRDELFKNYVGASINYVNATCDLYEAKAALEDFDRDNAKNPSQSGVEPERELFEYYVVDDLSGHRAIGVVQATDINEATEIMKNSIKPNYFCVTHVNKLEFNDKGFCDIYSGF